VPALHALVRLLKQAPALLALQQLRPAVLMELYYRLGRRGDDLLTHELLMLLMLLMGMVKWWGWGCCCGFYHHHVGEGVVDGALMVEVCGLGVAEGLTLEAVFVVVRSAPARELAIVETWLP
jgi:hypothetical protein